MNPQLSNCPTVQYGVQLGHLDTYCPTVQLGMFLMMLDSGVQLSNCPTPPTGGIGDSWTVWNTRCPITGVGHLDTWTLGHPDPTPRYIPPSRYLYKKFSGPFSCILQ